MSNLVKMHDGRWKIEGQNTHMKYRIIKYNKVTNWKTQK